MKWIKRSVNWDYGKNGKNTDVSFFPVSEDVDTESYDEEFKNPMEEAYKGDDNFKGVDLEVIDHTEVSLEEAKRTENSISALIDAWKSNIREGEAILNPLQILIEDNEFKTDEGKIEVIDNFIKMD